MSVRGIRLQRMMVSRSRVPSSPATAWVA